MGMYTNAGGETLQLYEPVCMLLIQTSPPLVRTHTSNPAFPTGGGTSIILNGLKTVTHTVHR